jgi:hypothetical protein
MTSLNLENHVAKIDSVGAGVKHSTRVTDKRAVASNMEVVNGCLFIRSHLSLILQCLQHFSKTVPLLRYGSSIDWVQMSGFYLTETESSSRNMVF